MRKSMLFLGLLGAAAFGRSLSGQVVNVPVLARAAATEPGFVKETAHFAVFYSTTGIHAIAGASVDQDGNGVPDNVDDIAVELERIWRLAVDTLGFPAPAGVTVERQTKVKVPAGKFPIRLADMATSSTSFGPDKVMGYCTDPGLDSLNPDGMEVVVENDFINSYDGKAFQVKVSPENTPGQMDSVLYDYSKRPDLGWRVTLAHEFFHALQKQYDKGFYMAYHEMSAVWFAHRAYPTIHHEWQYLQKFADIVAQPSFSYYQQEEYAEWPLAMAMVGAYGEKFMKKIWDYRYLIMQNGSVADEADWFNNVLATLGEDESLYNSYLGKMAVCLRLNLRCSDTYFDGFQVSPVRAEIASPDTIEQANTQGYVGGGVFQVDLLKVNLKTVSNGWNMKVGYVEPTNSSIAVVARLPSQTVEVYKPIGVPYVFNRNQGDTAVYFATVCGYNGIKPSAIYVGTTKSPVTGIRNRSQGMPSESTLRMNLQGRPLSGTHHGISLEFVPGKGWVRRVKVGG